MRLAVFFGGTNDVHGQIQTVVEAEQDGFDGIWFGILYVMTCEMAYLTPPYGFNLFYMRAIAPPEITMIDIYISIVPFVGLQVVGLVLVVIFPQIALWLPNLLFG